METSHAGNRVSPHVRPRARIVALFALASATVAFGKDEFAAPLPAAVSAVWDAAKAQREVTPSCERICLNGLWRWQPANEASIPTNHWGYFKVPGTWPGITDYMQKDSQTVFPHESWENARLANLTAAWYEREFTVPDDWKGRRIVVSTEYLNSFAIVYIDGKKAGEMRFPSGEVDVTSLCPPGEKHVVSLLVRAMPLKAVLLSYTDSASAREVKGTVARRGLCGDVYLSGIRETPRISGVNVRTSVRESEITFRATAENLVPTKSYRLRAKIKTQANETTLESGGFAVGDLSNGTFTFTQKWKPEKFWDIHTPENQYEAVVSLVDAEGTEIDAVLPTRFGFRELWIDGRDFYLNGSRIFLSAVPLDNAEVGAAWATYDAARESLARLKSFGINFVYTHNYGCEPGSHLSFDEILKAADDVGMLVALSQPHFSHYEWKSPDADRTNGYAAHAQFYAKVAGNHPSVVFYSMSHNATGYNEDMNPDMIDGLHDPRDQWSSNNAKLALRVEAIVSRLDPGRIVYHHASGNLGSMHPMNFYPNFVPPQELSDWFGHWATNGVKPAFMCEYGAPFTWDWTMYRGWYKGQREFGSAKVPWEFCVAEWNAQFLGDRAYEISEAEKRNLRWEAQQFRAGNLWHRWDYPVPVGSNQFEERYPVFALYLTDNWRAFRGWGVSGISPWEYEHFWKLRDGVDKRRVDFKVDWENLQRPGYSPDYIAQRYERMDLAFAKDDWIPTLAAKALIRNNGPLLSFIAGKNEAFTSKDHNYYPGDLVEKQIIVINNSRETVRCEAEWSSDLPQAAGHKSQHTLPTGEQVRISMRVELPRNLAAGEYKLNATVQFSSGETQRDSFTIHVLPAVHAPEIKARVALFDPKGETEARLKRHGILFTPVEANSEFTNYDILVIGKAALAVNSPAPDVSRVRDGLRVIVFEQESKVLEKRFGFRVTEYGLRQLFPRVPDHPVLAGLSAAHLRDWRGEATLLPPRLTYEMRPRYGPTVKWCDIPVTRLWRCGNRGNVASVLIEKPARGDFLPILDGGYSLQYSPLLEYREGKGMVLFSQLDLSGRTESDPAAETLARNIFEYVSNWKAAPQRKVVYAGAPAGKSFLESIGLTPESPGTNLSRDKVLILGPGARQSLGISKEQVGNFLKDRGNILAIGLAQEDANAVLPQAISTREQEHIAAYFPAPAISSPRRGVSSADVHNRDPRTFHLVRDGAAIIGDGVLAEAGNGNILFFQMAPWEFEKRELSNVKRTYRRAAFAVSRLAANLGAISSCPILGRFATAPDLQHDKRWLEGLYVDLPEEWDDPYRFFRW
jgi:beta-galactosidase